MGLLHAPRKKEKKKEKSTRTRSISRERKEGIHQSSVNSFTEEERKDLLSALGGRPRVCVGEQRSIIERETTGRSIDAASEKKTRKGGRKKNSA